MCRKAWNKGMCSVSRKSGVFHCGVGHVAGDQKGPVRVRQIEVSRVRAVLKMSYAEAVRKVDDGG